MNPDVKIAIQYVNKSRSAQSRGLEFSITFAQFKKLRSTKRCAYTDIVMTDSDSKEQADTDRTIDRIRQSEGYVPGNVVACCHAANQAKGHIEAPGKFMTVQKTQEMLNRVASLTAPARKAPLVDIKSREASK